MRADFINTPNEWGHVFHLSPEEEVTTVELFEATDSAIDDLPRLEMRLITLVDIEGVSWRMPRGRSGLAGHVLHVHSTGRGSTFRGALERYLMA